MNRATLTAIRSLDDARLWQFLVLLEDFGSPVATAWLEMCWRHDANPAINSDAASVRSTDGTCVFEIRPGGKPGAEPTHGRGRGSARSAPWSSTRRLDS